MIDLLGHIAYLFLMTGTYLAARNQACGWAIRAVGSAAWMGLGVSMGLSSIWLWSGVFLMIDISAWSKWRRAKLEEEEELLKVSDVGDPRPSQIYPRLKRR